MTAKRGDTINAKISLNVGGIPLKLDLDVPVGVVPLTRMLPVFRQVSEKFVGHAVNLVREAGLEVSCKKGCTSCCRQLIPVSETEVHDISRIISQLPEKRRLEILERFRAAKLKLSEAGLMEALSDRAALGPEETSELGLRYLGLEVDCPFLENESCSIYAERPMVCREYLAVSPAENCKRKNNLPVELVSLPARVSRSLNRLTASDNSNERKWIPLVLVTDADCSRKEESKEEGTDLFRRLFADLAKTEIPPAR